MKNQTKNLGNYILLHIKKLPKVNNHPIGENSTNLVTLTEAQMLKYVKLISGEIFCSPTSPQIHAFNN
jgi:hypothetical protein